MNVRSTAFAAAAAVLATSFPVAGAHAQGLSQASSRMGALIRFRDGSCDGARLAPAGADEAGVQGAVVGALVATAADFAVGWIGQLLQARKDALNGQFVAFGVGDVKAGDGSMCMTLYRGPLSSAPGNGIKRGQPGAFLLEADVAFTGEAVRMTPRHLDYGLTSAKRSTRTKNVGVVVAFTATALAGNATVDDSKALAVFRLNLGELELGRSYGETLLAGTEATAGLEARRRLFNAAGFVTESSEAGPALEALIEAFNSNKDDLTKALVAAVKPKKE